MVKKVVTEQDGAYDAQTLQPSGPQFQPEGVHDAGTQFKPGGPQETPPPVNTGDVHANRAPDQLNNTDTDIAIVPGVGEVSHAVALQALLSKLAGLPTEVLMQIANGESEVPTLEEEPAGGVPDGNRDHNLGTIATFKEDINDIFAGEELTEDFRNKAAVIYEASLGARLIVLEAEMEEKYQVKITEAVEQVTEQMVDQIDRYLSYTAEQYVEENKPVLEETVRSTVAEEFMNGVINLARQYNINLPESQVDVVGGLSDQITELEQKLNESLDREIAKDTELKSLKNEKVFEEVSEGLTLTQKEKLRTLSEHVEVSSPTEFNAKLEILKESVLKAAVPEDKPALTTALISEEHDGVPALNEGEGDSKPASTPEMKQIMEAIKRISK